ncbi:hypothetical protein BKA70DRAFT_1248232 [Coprinopsis sp. MPI-PUGE-AT-0042]|nr:hypothetical protein BKA70DRAFT_1248232 [Coprinopsis sp. MPI-PUGE-AT-0042]
MAGSNFKDRWLPLIVFPSFLAVGVKYVFKHSLFRSGLGDLTAGSCSPDAQNVLPFNIPYTSHATVDRILCKLVALFHFTLGSDLGYSYFTYIVSTASVIILFMGLEASRARRSTLVGYPTLWLLLSQLISVGLAIPLYWLTFFALNNPRDMHPRVEKKPPSEKKSSTPQATSSYKISQAQAEAVLFGLVVGAAVPSYAMMCFKSDPHFAAIWQIYPIFMAVASGTHLLFRTLGQSKTNPESPSAKSGRSLVQTSFMVYFVGSSLLHLAMVWPANGKAGLLEGLKALLVPSLTPLAVDTPTALKTVEFLKWDYTLAVTSTMAATLWFARSFTELLAMIVWYAAGTVVEGPCAALAVVFLWREYHLEY